MNSLRIAQKRWNIRGKRSRLRGDISRLRETCRVR